MKLLWNDGRKRYLDLNFVESLPPSLWDENNSLINELRQRAFAEPEFNLHVAIQNEDINKVEFLIANGDGAFLEREDNYGNRAVHYAVMKYFNSAKLLKL